MTEAQRHQILLELGANRVYHRRESDRTFRDFPATARRDINKLDESGKLKSP